MNPFQAQYPLSPKKFWKKMIPTIIGYAVFLFVVAIITLVAGLAFEADTIPNWLNLPTIMGIAIALYVVILLLWAWYFKAYIRTYFYEGGDNFVTIRKNVFTPSEIHVQYQKIQDVYVDQDILDRILGIYDVHIASATAASGIEAHIDGVNKEAADGLKNFFFMKIQQGSNQQPPSAAAMPSDTSAPASVSAPAPFMGAISSVQYPIQSKWFLKSAIGFGFSSFLYMLILSVYFMKDTEVFSSLGIYIALLLVIFIVQLIGLALWKKNYRFEFLPEYIQFHTGILSQSERHLPYKSIQDVTINRSLLDRMFGLANVNIENAAQTIQVNRSRRTKNGVTIVGISPESAQQITETIKNVILTKNSSQMGV